MKGALLRPALPWVGAALASSALAAGVVVNSQLTFVLAIALIGLATLTAPASAWVLFALIGALSFKGLVSLGALPSVLTFIDLPLAWGALFVALLKQQDRSPFLRRHLRWLAALGLAVALAWAFNPSEVLRPLLYLALLGEPFAIVGALLADPPSPRMRLALERALLALVLIQIPLAAAQFAAIGHGDHIQGTLYKAGAGAHVISAVSVVGAVWILSGGIGRRVLGIGRLPVVAALLFIPFLADAKQVIIALPAIVLASSWKVGRLQYLLRGALVAGSFIALFTLAPAADTAQRFIEQNQQGQGGKQATALLVWHKLNRDPASLAFGKGPAETISRAAFMTLPTFADVSPLAKLGLKPSAIADEAQSAALDVSGGGTSSNSGMSSMLGVLGDLGIFGFLMYAGLLISLFLRLRTETSAEGIAAGAGFALFTVLGLVFDWWEQPPFGIFIGVLAGVSLAAQRPRSRTKG